MNECRRVNNAQQTVPTKTKIPSGDFFVLCTEGFERAEAKQVDFQQKGNAACVDECEEYEHSALPRTRNERAAASE